MSQPDLANVITFNPWAIAGETTLTEAARMIADLDCHHWPVVAENRQLVGIVSYGDIAQAIEQRLAATAGVAAFDGAYHSAAEEAPRVEEIMTRDVQVVEQQQAVSQVLQNMLGRQVHSLPVVSDERLIGMVTSADFLREFSYGDMKCSRDLVAEHTLRFTEVVDQDASLDEALETLQIHGCECIAVVHGDFPLGAISRTMVQLAKFQLLVEQLLGSPSVDSPQRVSQLLPDAITIRPGQTLCDLANLLLECGQETAAVVQGRRLVGVISEQSILNAMLTELMPC